MGEIRNMLRILVGKPEIKKKYLRDLIIEGRMLLKFIFKK
jgi:hypothetical protein